MHDLKFKETIKNNKTNDLTEVEKLMYEDEIEKLKISIEQLKGKNEQIAELKDSIELSSKTANTLINLEQENRDKLENYIVKIEQKYYELDSKKKNLLEENFSEILKDINSSIDTPSPELLDKEAFEDIYLALEKLDTKLDDMEDNYELKVDKLNERFTKLISNPKNEKRLRRISKQVKGFEQKLEKVRLGQDSTITLSLIESDLNKIEKIMRKHKRISIYQTYCVARQVLLGVVLMMSIIALFINEPYSEFIKEFSLSSIVKFLK